MLDKVRAMLRDRGAAAVGRLIWDRYLRDQLQLVAGPDGTQTYDLRPALAVCIPSTSPDGLRFVAEQIKYLTAHRPAPKVVVTVPALLPNVPSVADQPNVSVRVLPTDDPLVLISLVTDGALVIMDRTSAGPAGHDLLTVLGRLGIQPHSSARELGSANPVERTWIRGTRRSTYPTYRQLQQHLHSGHYAYREPLAWSIVQELPDKYERLSTRARIEALPLSSLFVGEGRIARQFGVGQKYGPRYFQGESVLDVGCDLCGVRRYVGPSTRYVGVDMQGLADYHVNLDREDLPFPDRSFATVLCFEALEHFNDIHGHFDKMLGIADRFLVGSLYVESGNTGGRSLSRFGVPLGNMHLPMAPVFDRHQWVFSFADALDFIYYRGRRAGFDIVELNFFYSANSTISHRRTQSALVSAFRRGDVDYLSRHVSTLGFALERSRAAGS